MATHHLLIKGKVQGVFYRTSAKQMAESLGITGWVKNTEEGEVEAVATGNDLSLQKFVTWCKKGPAAAQVSDVIVTTMIETAFEGFTVIR